MNNNLKEGGTKPSVTVIILNWNGVNDTIDCVNSLLKLTYENKRIVVIDNASAGNDAERLKSYFGQKIDLVQNSKNEGFAQGNNTGISYAQNKYNPDYYWLINNDTVADQNALTELVNLTFTNQNLGIIGSQIRYYNSSKIYCLGGGKINLWTGIDRLWGAKLDYHKSFIPKYFSFICGCSFFFSKSVLETIKGFDPDYFLYSEEADFCMRTKKAGYNFGYSPASLIYHKSAQSTGYHSSKYIYYFLRNKLLFMKKNTSWPHWISFLPFYIFYYCVGFSWRCLRKNGYIPLRIIYKSVKDFILCRLAEQDVPNR